ncbi:MAG: hypothetical protein ABIO67_12000 [Mycobacteriales bacterium]
MSSPIPREPGERLVLAGVAVFSVGLLAIVTIVIAFLLGSDNAPLPLTLLSLLMPVGLALGLLGLLRRARR